MEPHIILKGCRTHNLKNFDLRIPLHKITAVVGVSGAGKSSLVLHTLYAEAYLRYVESISPFIRRYLDMVEKPDVDAIENLPPALAFRQMKPDRNARSIVATAAGLFDYLRVLYARAADLHCPGCGRIVREYSLDEMVAQVLSLGRGRIQVVFEYRGDIGFLRSRGYSFHVKNGERREITAAMRDKRMLVLVDEITIAPENKGRIFEALEQSLAFSGKAALYCFRKKEFHLPAVLYCPNCRVQYDAADEDLFSFTNPKGACPACRGSGEERIDAPVKTSASGPRASSGPCPQCGGGRFHPRVLAFRVEGKSIADFLALTVAEADSFIRALDSDRVRSRLPADILVEIESKLGYLIANRLHHLQLGRSLSTLSRGELHWINLAFMLGSTLSDSLLVMDQPAADLHPGEFGRLRGFLENLRSNGNTLILIEQHPEMIQAADQVIELGPGPGKSGGEVIFAGSPEVFFAGSRTPTQRMAMQPPSVVGQLREPQEWLHFANAASRNLKHFDFRLPLGDLTVITGVSGAGKSVLLYDEIYARLRRDRRFAEVAFLAPGPGELRANTSVAGFFGISQPLREFFATLPESRRLRYLAGHFSFNSPLGRCPECKGSGHFEVEMQFLPAVMIRCAACSGTGFLPEVLQVTFRGKNIAQILQLTILEFAEEFSGVIPAATAALESLVEMGLGYLQLGQKLGNLSSGELQKVKLGKFLQVVKPPALLLVDKPSFGLHLQDMQEMGKMMRKVVDSGNTLVAADHHPGLLDLCGFVLELGPEGGDGGGYLLFSGTTGEYKRRSG